MKIESEESLRRAYTNIVRMYELIDKIAADTTGYPETRSDEIDGVHAMIHKIERQIAAYYAEHPERIAKPKPVWETEVEEEAEKTREPEPVT